MVSRTDEEDDSAQSVSIEFLMGSGETFTVQDFVDTEALEEGVRKLGEQLVAEMGTPTIRRFPYWEGDAFYFDAVRMEQVAAFSISTSDSTDDDLEG